MKIGVPLFQYKETDYEFLKRVASLLRLEVICDIINLNNLFYYGRPDGKKYTLEDEVNYKACKDLERYNKAQVFGIDFHDTDFFYYEVENLKKMDIGDKIYFKQKDLYVNQYEAKLHQGELIYKYRFCRERGIWQDKIYNQKIKGVSIEGKVLETAGEKLKIHLNIDESQDPSKAAWFYYAPPTGNILYSMPLVNESAMLYFQDIIEAAPIATNCVRKNGDTCAELSDTANRYFATESGNYLDMLPGAINFHRSGFNVNLNDQSGITFNSSGNLSIGASGSVSLSAGSVAISATSKLLVQKNKSSYISLENEFYAESSVVYESGSARDSYGAFTDDEPTAGVAAAIAKKVAESIEFAVGALVSAIAGMVAVLGSIPGETSSSDNGNSVPVVGEELKNNEDIKEFNSNRGYGSETLVKEKSGDGVYVLGKTNTIQTASGEKSSFVPVDMDSYLEHNSPGKYLKSDLLALGNVAQETIISTGEMASYELENSTIIGPARHLYDGYKKVTGEAPFGGALEDFDVMKKAREKCSSISSDIHDYLYDMAPYKDEFNLANFTFNVALIAVPIAGQLKNIPKLAELGMNASKKLASKIPKATDDLAEFFKNLFKDTKTSYVKSIEKYTDDMRKYIIPPEDGFDALIERRYIDIRKAGFSDVSDIAKNTGLPEQDIIDMKNHLFFNTHDLSVQGKPPEKLYFQGNANIAYGWEKARSGEITKTEKDWFEALRNHELTEKKYMDDGMPLTDPSTWDPVKERQGTDPFKNAHDKANLTAEAPSDFPGYADIANKEWNKNYMNKSNDY
ncbi:hypothetical protein psyc5s11_35220 [Clostridium gelidum]|uniref:Uncharacterized protein n=1 Tax=Clostridium gelidum TaxID=704125 RepID=A0ABM7T8U2_9CLOT|nr:hypothetical protein [Clostridium gelidum]BCZ47455.1 hypothetical protein psyc5s11_35220 [Clostridium gelidum]